MVFSSGSFLFLFLPSLLTVYFLIPQRHHELKNMVFLLFSLVFYSYGGWRLLPIILTSILINYFSGRLVAPGRRDERRKHFLVLAVICNLALLFWFKYVGFFTAILHGAFQSVPVLQVVLPIGISFYTFQGISYVVDVYRGTAPSEKNLLRVALYIAMFPQLLAGPIVRYNTIAKEIRKRRETLEDFYEGAIRFLFGLAKKMLLANQMAMIADAAFAASPGELTTGLAWLGVIAYTAQIYFDFSGYSDMVLGLGRMFGFHLLENFNYPYISKSITEFWRRWHISLSTWFRDYLYIPLGGNRVSRTKQIRNLLIVWGLTGFWHGAAWNFLLWGLFYALLLIGERYLWGAAVSRLPKPFQHVYALFCIMMGWLIFRAEGLAQIGVYLEALFGLGAAGAWSGQVTYLLLQFRWELILAVAASLPLRDKVKGYLEARQHRRIPALLLCWGVPVLAGVLGLLAGLQLLGSSFNPFIYFQF